MDVGLWLHFIFYLLYLSKSVILTSELSQKTRSELTEVVLTYNSNRTTTDKGHRLNLTFVVLLTHNVSENENDCIMAKVLPAIELAIHNIQKIEYMAIPVDVTLVSRDTFCSSIFGGIGLYEIYSQWKVINAIFGLSCDYVLAPISRYSGVWEIPVFSSSGRPISYDIKINQYDTLTRLSGSIGMIKQTLISLMDNFNWTQSAILFQNVPKHKGNSVCYFCMAGLQFEFDNFEFVDIEKNVTKHLNSISEKARVIIMCADPQSIRKIMLEAEHLKMIDSGEYVFINIELFSRVPQGTAQPWYNKNDTVENNERAKKAYTALLTVSPKQPDDEEYLKFSEEIKQIAADKYNYTFDPDESLSTFVTSFYDAVLLYTTALNDSITEDPTMLTRPINGTDIVRRMWNRQFQGITGNITIDSNGDRVTTYSLLDMNPTTGRFEIVANFLQNRLEYVEGKSIHWAGGRKDAPPDKPVCGFNGGLCPAIPVYAILSLILGVIVIGMTIGSFFGYRHFKSEAEINSMTWRVYYHEVIPCDINERYRGGAGGSMHSLGKRGAGGGSQLTIYSDDIVSLAGDRQLFIPVGLYKGSKVAIKNINETNITLNRPLMLELKRMKDIQNDHLVKFYGACVDPPKSFLLTEYCPKGSLQDILENEQITLDWMFKLSLMHDIVKGMHFLHCSEIKSHGNLKSSNCVVDSRFVLKITDFGLHQLRKPDINDDEENCNSYAYWKKLLWTAPELLRIENRPQEGTTKGDVYSFGIIIHEIITRQGPFYLGPNEKSPQEIIELVKGYSNWPQSTPFRPHMDDDAENDCEDINEMMIKCWSEEAIDRPDFGYLKSKIRKINKDNETGNIVDNLLKRMEQYANNLEGLVDERTQKYLEEKRKYEELLYKLLPQSVASQLISKQVVMAESFDQVTIYFSDIVGFTAISAESTPMEVVEFLNDLYTEFDKIVENFDVYKVETIGDAYMVVSGLPIRNGNLHAQEIARLSLALLNAVYRFKIHHRPDDQLKLRIGLHSGPCVAGVVGKKMPRYCLFGDTVNTASRMESNGEALKIHISQTTKEHLDKFGTFIMKERGLVAMKGKGDMRTYWLEGEIKLPPTMITNNLINSNNNSNGGGFDRSRTNSLRRSYHKDLSKSQLSILKQSHQQQNNILPKSPLAANQQQHILLSSSTGHHSRSQSPTLLANFNDNISSNNDFNKKNNINNYNVGDNQNKTEQQQQQQQQNSSIFNQNSNPKMMVVSNNSITNINSNNETNNSQNLIKKINDVDDVVIDDNNKLPNKLLNNINNSNLISDNIKINNDIDDDNEDDDDDDDNDDINIKININNDDDDTTDIHHNLLKHNNSNNIVVVNNFNNIIKSNNLKNLKCNSTNNSNNISSNNSSNNGSNNSSNNKNLMTSMSTTSNNSDDNLNNKSVTQPLLTKINS